jgi:hypothetical protein
MPYGDIAGIGDGGQIYFTVPVEQFGSMGGKHSADALIDGDAQLLGAVDDKILPRAGTNFHRSKVE